MDLVFILLESWSGGRGALRAPPAPGLQRISETGGAELGSHEDSRPSRNSHLSRKSKDEGNRSAQAMSVPRPALTSSYSVVLSSEPLEAAELDSKGCPWLSLACSGWPHYDC